MQNSMECSVLQLSRCTVSEGQGMLSDLICVESVVEKATGALS